MKREWRSRRELLATLAGQRRWDRTYQEVLTWTRPGVAGPLPGAGTCPGKEREDARGAQCASVDAAAGAGADHCAATGAAADPCGRAGGSVADRHVFRDDGYSGASLRRPGLDRLRDAVAAGEVDRVLLTAPDRLARNYVHQALLLEELERAGCQVAFLDRPMSADPHDQLLLQIHGAVAEYERSVLAERMRRGRQRKLRAGLLLPWTRAPYDYRLDPGRPRAPAGVRVEAAEATVVQELFATYIEAGTGLIGLAKALARRGILTPNG